MSSSPPIDRSHLLPLPPPVEPAGPALGLPAPLTPLIGREREVAAIQSTLCGRGVRLVTLTGPGGVGKTRLAVEVAHRLSSAYADGVAFVPLAATQSGAPRLPGALRRGDRSADLVAATVARALGLDIGHRPPFDALVTHLRRRQLLLALDNFEHLLPAAPLLTELLQACPALTLLVTSRVRLRLAGEHDFPVPPLAVPEPARDARDTSSVEHVASYPAVRLFVERARAAYPAFVLTDANAPVIAELCRRLDGLPLAIELAAPRTRILSPSALLARLTSRLQVLTGGPQDAPPRLRSMRDAITWSHDLLAPDERALFRRLAVFVGGFTLEAAEQVAGGGWQVAGGEESPSAPATRDPSPATLAVLDGLTALVDASLVQRGEGPDGEARFGMLETVREYGLEQLAASGEEAAVRAAHAAWCLAFAERAEPELSGPEQMVWVKRIEAELGNVRAAHAWLFERGESERALRLGGALGWFWSQPGYFREARDLFNSLLAMPGAEDAPAALAKVLWSAGDVEDWLGELERARAHFERALATFRDLDDRHGIASMMRGLGSVALAQGDLERAEALLQEARTLAREIDVTWEAAAATNLLGRVAFARGDYAEAIARHEEALADWRRLGTTEHVVAALSSLASAALISGDHARAVATYRTTLELAGASDDELAVAECLVGFGGLALANGDAARATRLFAAAAREFERIGVARRPADQAAADRMIKAARAALGEAEFAAAWAAGRTLPVAEAIAEARVVLGSEPSAPSPAAAPPTAPPDHRLTPREVAVLRLLVEGKSDKEIAAALGIGRRTAARHVAALLAKLGAPSRAAAAGTAVRAGLV